MVLTFAQVHEIKRAVLSAISPFDAESRLLMIAILEHYNYSDGCCRPSVQLLADETRLGRTTICDRLKKLVKGECLDLSRTHHRAYYDFTPKLPPWAADVPRREPSRGSPRDTSAPSKGSPREHKQEEESSLTKQNRVTGAAARTLLRQYPEDLAALIVKLQQVPGKPGCRHDRLIPKVLKAIERCGQKAVEDLYALVAPEKGRLEPWRLYQMLDGLEPHSDQQARPEPEPLPPDAPLIVEAKGLVEAAVPNIPDRIRLEARIRAADVDFKSIWWKECPHKLAQALARAMATERGISP